MHGFPFQGIAFLSLKKNSFFLEKNNYHAKMDIFFFGFEKTSPLEKRTLWAQMSE
jgi:hypothetical protein